MIRYCFALDLNPDPQLIADYEAHHRAVWPAVLDSIRDSGITHLEIYRIENRLFMILDAHSYFSLEAKAIADAQNPIVQEWETLMWQYQQALPTAQPGQKWIQMELIFQMD